MSFDCWANLIQFTDASRRKLTLRWGTSRSASIMSLAASVSPFRLTLGLHFYTGKRKGYHSKKIERQVKKNPKFKSMQLSFFVGGRDESFERRVGGEIVVEESVANGPPLTRAESGFEGVEVEVVHPGEEFGSEPVQGVLHCFV